jgi:hypothetical protein
MIEKKTTALCSFQNEKSSSHMAFLHACKKAVSNSPGRVLSAKDQFDNGPVMLTTEAQICDRDLQKKKAFRKKV